jgi:hypothetical protein
LRTVDEPAALLVQALLSSADCCAAHQVRAGQSLGDYRGGQLAISLPLFDGTNVDQDRPGCQLIIKTSRFHAIQYRPRPGKQRINR